MPIYDAGRVSKILLARDVSGLHVYLNYGCDLKHEAMDEIDRKSVV